MKLYTKTGDGGETSLFGGKRVQKDSMRIEAYGTVDELNSVLGVCRSMNTAQEIDSILHEIQNDLFVLGAELATPEDTQKKKSPPIDSIAIERLERHIDVLDSKVEPLKSFILPGGNRAAAMLHFARTICRRGERNVISLSHAEPINTNNIVYLNRLSDLLFILARYVNALSNTVEIKWNA